MKKKRSSISERIVRYHEGRAPDLLALKYAAMAANPFSFYRGSCQLFRDAWPAHSALDGAPAVWSCGDLHFENLGCYKGDNRLAYFDLNDFDEAALLPVSWDVTRFAASIMVGAPRLNVTAASATALSALYLDAFGAALATGKARWVERDTATGMVRALLDTVRGRSRKMLLKERTKLKGERRRLRVDGMKALKASKVDVAMAERVMARVGASSGKKKFYRVLDVARRIAGCGSLGLTRLIVLVEGTGSPRGNYLLELKEARSPAPGKDSPYQQPKWKTEADRIVAIQSRVQAASPAMLASIKVNERSFILRELQPLQDRLRMEAWNGDSVSLQDAMITMGRVTAWAALRGSGRQGSATADDLISYANGRDWKRGVLAMSKRVATRTVSQWREVRADLKSGALSG